MSGSRKGREAELVAAGWEFNEDFHITPWRWPGVSGWETEADALRILDGELCPAKLCHGPGHQSSTRCEKPGQHDDHECHYLTEGGRVLARWRTGDYTGALREKGIEFSPSSYPETIGMTGYFNEPPGES